MTTPVNEIVDSLKVRVAGAGNNTWPQLSVSPSNSLWLTDSADPLNTSSNAALQMTVTPNSAFIEALGTDGVTNKQLQLGNAGGVALVPNGGNVGIGTASPSQALEVAGSVKATSFVLGNTPVVSSQWTSGAGGLSFAGGNVGIGTTTPSQALEVNGSVKASAFLLGNAPIVSSQWTSGASGISFAGGAVGIGTTTPSQALEVAGAVKATSFVLGNAPIVSSQWTSGASGLSFAGGNVGIGTASPSEALEVAGSVKATSFVLPTGAVVSSQWTSGAGGISFAGGNVGIGTATPSEALEVAGAVKAASFLLNNAPMVSSQWTSGAGGISFAGGNVGIGTATPSQALDVAGTVKANAFMLGNAPLVNSQWANVAGGISFAGGNVGIGTATPREKLDVNGNIRLNDKDVLLRGGSDAFHGIGWHGTGKLFANTNVDGPVVYGFSGGALGSTNGGEKIALSWNTAGAVGVGTTSPNGLLDVGNLVRIGLNEGNSGAKVITFARDAADEINSGKIAYKPSWDAGVLGIVGVGTPTTPRRIKLWDQVETTGSLLVGDSVGVGTASPRAKLQAAGDVVIGNDANGQRFILHTRGQAAGDFFHFTGDDGNGNWDWSKGIIFARGTGNVGIGRFPTQKLHVAGSYVMVDGAGGEQVYIGGDGFGNDVQIGSFRQDCENVATWNPTTGRRMNMFVRNLFTEGGVSHLSDARLKTNVAPLTGVLDRLDGIRAIAYEWRDDPSSHRMLGVLAQEVEAVFPELVRAFNAGDDYKSVDQMGLVSVLLAAVKELRREVAALKTSLGPTAG